MHSLAIPRVNSYETLTVVSLVIDTGTAERGDAHANVLNETAAGM
jgi:hypothetical protein